MSVVCPIAVAGDLASRGASIRVWTGGETACQLNACALWVPNTDEYVPIAETVCPNATSAGGSCQDRCFRQFVIYTRGHCGLGGGVLRIDERVADGEPECGTWPRPKEATA